MIIFNDNRLFEMDEAKYIFSAPDNKIFEIDNKVKKLIEFSGSSYEKILEEMNEDYTKEELDEILSNMKQNGFLNNSVVRDYAVKNLRSLTLLLVQGCNLRCRYCYAEDGQYNDSGEMSEETAFKAVDFLLEKSPLKDIGLCFFGGEPLLRFELIKKIVKYCNEKEKVLHRKFHYSMTTNGTLINDEIRYFIEENKIEVQISIDGDEKTHNTHRYFANKVGSHQFVMKKTSKLRADKRLTARATITKESMEDIENNYLYLLENGFKSVAMSPTFDILEDIDFEKLISTFQKMYLHCEEMIKLKNYDNAKKNKMFMQEMQRIHNAARDEIACGVGRYTYAIDVHGNIFPCQRFVSNKEYCIGNVYSGDEKRKDFLKKIALINHEKCQKCWARNLCRGGCVHVNLAMTGDVCLPDSRYCRYVKSINECLIEIYLRLTEEEKIKLLGGVDESFNSGL